MSMESLQYNVTRFFEYWQQGVDDIFGSDNDNSDEPLLCPFYRDGYVYLQSDGFILESNYYDISKCKCRCTITNDNDQFLSDLQPLDYLPESWNSNDVLTAYDICLSKFNSTNFGLGMSQAQLGETLYFDTITQNQFLRTSTSTYPFDLRKDNNTYLARIATSINGVSTINLNANYSNYYTFYSFGYINDGIVGSKISSNEISEINNYNEYHNHYTEDGITVYYSDEFCFITYDGDKSYNQVQNVVNNAYNNDNSITNKIYAPSYESLKNGDKHPYYIAPLQPLQIPELGEMSLPPGDFGDAPKILAESVNEMTGLLDHLGLTAIFIVCALLVFIIRKVRD